MYDCETSPVTAYVFQTGTQYIGANQLLSHTKVICVSYRFDYWPTGKVKHLKWDSKQDDKSLVKKFAKIAEKADYIVGHNGDGFDKKTLNARLAYHRLPTISHLNTEDTLKQVRREFKLPSYRLDYLCKYFDLDGKLSTSSSLWKDVTFKNCRKSLAKMVEYCDNDTLILSELFERLKPYIKLKYRYSAATDNSECCPKCGNTEYRKYGMYYSITGKFQKYMCKSCSHVFRDGCNLNTSGKKLKR